MALPGRFVLLPGLGADGRMFRAQKAAFARLETPNWIPPAPGESLFDYSQRFAEILLRDGPIDILGGASLGGIVALQMAPRVKPRVVVLCGSGRAPEVFPKWVRICLPVFSRMPLRRLLRAAMLPPLRGIIGPTRPPASELFDAMLRDADPDFVTWAIRALRGWTEVDPGAPVLAIHGRHDRLFPVKRVEPNHIVEGAAHVPSMSHPAEVNAWLERVVQA